MKKRILASVLSMLVVIGSVIGMIPSTVKADISSESLIYDVEYVDIMTNNMEDTDMNKRLFVVPADGIVEFDTLSNEIGFACVSDDRGLKITTNYLGQISSPKKFSIPLSKGKYYLGFNSPLSWGNGNPIYYTLSYKFDSSTNAKVSSPKSGQLKVTAPKGSNVDGFEIRYKTAGKDWTTVTVPGNKNLNKTITGLKKGTKYTVQTRKYVSDEYGYTYFSNWTKVQTVKVK